MALLARLCSSCSRLPSAEEQRLCERALRSPSRSPRSRHRAISDSRHNIAPPSHTIRTPHVQKSASTPMFCSIIPPFLTFTLNTCMFFASPRVVFAGNYFFISLPSVVCHVQRCLRSCLLLESTMGTFF